jgi:signal transduction histidine kinase
MMTHDLKSPLMVMLGHVQAIKLGMWGAVEGKVKASIEEIERSGLNICSMLENVLDVYRVEMGMLNIRQAACDIGRLLEESCRGNRLIAGEKQIELELHLPRVLPTLHADCKQLARVFNNLIGNAVKFTPVGGKVSVSCSAEGEQLRISVRDNGIGIAPKELPLVFNKYYRSPRASGFKGTGLGLTISRSIVEAHGGTIEVESTEGEGSEFSVKIPLKID